MDLRITDSISDMHKQFFPDFEFISIKNSVDPQFIFKLTCRKYNMTVTVEAGRCDFIHFVSQSPEEIRTKIREASEGFESTYQIYQSYILATCPYSPEYKRKTEQDAQFYLMQMAVFGAILLYQNKII